jgi:hypothetical protein
MRMEGQIANLGLHQGSRWQCRIQRQPSTFQPPATPTSPKQEEKRSVKLRSSPADRPFTRRSGLLSAVLFTVNTHKSLNLNFSTIRPSCFLQRKNAIIHKARGYAGVAIPCCCGLCGSGGSPRNAWMDKLFAANMATGMAAYEEAVAPLKRRLFADVSPRGPGLDVLELGIGTGPNLRYYANQRVCLCLTLVPMLQEVAEPLSRWLCLHFVHAGHSRDRGRRKP